MGELQAYNPNPSVVCFINNEPLYGYLAPGGIIKISNIIDAQVANVIIHFFYFSINSEEGTIDTTIDRVH